MACKKVYKKNCPKCNKYQYFVRSSDLKRAIKNNSLCLSCSKKHSAKKDVTLYVKGVIKKSFIYKIKGNANKRNWPWMISGVYLADLLIEQNFKCALTGWKIYADESRYNTASLDRIDSRVGYVKGNVQWLHKDVNMAKGRLSDEYFIEMSKAITKFDIMKKNNCKTTSRKSPVKKTTVKKKGYGRKK